MSYTTKKLTRPGHEVSTEADHPTDSPKITVPDFKISAMPDMQEAVLNGLYKQKQDEEIARIQKEYQDAYNEYLANNKMESGLGDYDPDLGVIRHPSVLYDHYAREYAKNKTGYDLGDPILDQWKNNEKAKLTTAAIASSFPIISGISAGALGIIPKLALDLKFGYDGAKQFFSPEGVAKTWNFLKQGRLGRAAWSGLGDLVDFGFMRGGYKTANNLWGNLRQLGKDAMSTLKFNLANRGTGFRSYYPWEVNKFYKDNRGLPVVVSNIEQIPQNTNLELPTMKSLSLIPSLTQDAETSDYSKLDEAYKIAVESGNTAEINRLEDLMWKTKAPNAPRQHFLHGTLNDFNQFEIQRPSEQLFHFGDIKTAKSVPYNRIIEARLNITRPLEVFDAGRWWWPRILKANPKLEKVLGNGEEVLKTQEALTKQLGSQQEANAALMQKLNKDAFMYRNNVEGGGTYSVAVPLSRQIKLVGPTYDDNGKLIPLSQRFNFSNPDIRFGYASSDATTGNLAQIDNFFKKDIIPRMQRAGHNIDDTVTLPGLRVRDPNNIMDQFYNSNAGAYFDPVTNTATFRTLPEKADFGLSLHEIFGHGLRYNIHPDYKPISTQAFEQFLQKCKELGINPNGQTILGLNTADQLYTDVEKSLLDTAYEKWFDYGEGAGNRHEYGAVNTQLRGKISQQNGHVVGKELDPIIDKYPDARLLVMLRDQPYTGNGTIKILENITGLDPDDLQFMSEIELNNIVKRYPEISKLLKRIKDTMKYVGAVAPIGLGTNLMLNDNGNE